MRSTSAIVGGCQVFAIAGTNSVSFGVLQQFIDMAI
jgi:hypothetical protein